MKICSRLYSMLGVYSLLFTVLLLFPTYSFAATVTLDMVPPVSGSAHSANGAVILPVGILAAPL